MLTQALCNHLANILGGTGELKNGICTVAVQRENPLITIQGKQTSGLLGIGMNFTFESPDVDGNTLNLGDIPFLEHEIQPVISILAQYGIQISALHNQFVLESPKLIYLHFQSVQNPVHFAQVVKYALSAVQKTNGSSSFTSKCPNPYCQNPNCQCGKDCNCGQNYQC